MTIAVPQGAYPYLVAQRGALDDMRDNQSLWLAKYREVLESELTSIAPYLPASCKTILDVGGGMGGIDVLLNEHYGGDCEVTILDGINDLPQVTKHADTFSSKETARDFLMINGVRQVNFIDANAAELKAPHFYDLVVSFKAWCFHIPAERYAKFVSSCSIAGQTRIICDVRGGRRATRGSKPEDDSTMTARGDYIREMSKYFCHRGMIHYGLKFETHWWEA